MLKNEGEVGWYPPSLGRVSLRESPPLSYIKRGAGFPGKGGLLKFFGPCGGGLYIWGMFIFLLFLGALVVMSVVMGWNNADNVHITLTFKSLSHPYYRLGLSFHKEVYLDGEADVLIIGMFIFVVQVEFVKDHTQDYSDLFKDGSPNNTDDTDANANAAAFPDDSRL